MEWALMAITMTTGGEPNEYRQIALFETRAVCQYAPEAMRTAQTGAIADFVLDPARQWVLEFRCVPLTESALNEELDLRQQAARYLAGEGEYSAPWWRERLNENAAIGRD